MITQIIKGFESHLHWLFKNHGEWFILYSYIFINPFWYVLIQFQIHLNMCYRRAKNHMTLNLVVVNCLMFYYLRGLTLLHQMKVWWGRQRYTEKSIVYWPILLYGLCHFIYLSYKLPLRSKQLIAKSLQNNVFHKVFFRTCC